MDFIEQLPLSEDYMDILVIVDWLTKQAKFIPIIRVINTTILTELFIKYVFSKHGVSNHITFDWRMEFVLKFFRSLAGVLNIKLHFILDYYLKTDSQIEYTNQILEQFLRIYCNYQQSDWMLAYSHENLELNQGSCSERTQ